MIFTPRPWQQPIIEHIIDNRRSNVWAPMGAGKTSAVLTALEILDMCGSKFFPALVVAPLRVARDVWPHEPAKWDHLKRFNVSPIIGTESQRRLAVAVKADIYTINYDNIPWLVEYLDGRWPFLTVIADESTRLKGHRLNKGKIRTTSLARIASKAKRWINLTGTPSPNGLKDLWGQNWYVDFGKRLKPTYTGFKELWFNESAYSFGMEPKENAQKEIQEALGDVTVTIDMADYIDLQKPIVVPVPVTLPDKAMQQYREIEKKMFTELAADVEVTALTAAARSTKCLQMAAGAVYYGESKNKQWAEVHTAKLDALESIVEESAGANLMVFYHWKHDAERILKRFTHARRLITKRDLDDWNSGKVQLMIAHPKSAGHGLDLQFGGNRMVFFSEWWDLELKIQAVERLGPMRQYQSGFKRPVYIYQIYAADTLDEVVLECHASKAQVQDLLLAAMKKRKGETN